MFGTDAAGSPTATAERCELEDGHTVSRTPSVRTGHLGRVPTMLARSMIRTSG